MFNAMVCFKARGHINIYQVKGDYSNRKVKGYLQEPCSASFKKWNREALI